MGATNCPETPRQKMISMMYLVLTAMLALNVSVEILQGYSLVDRSLRKSIDIADKRNTSLNIQFDNLVTQNPQKAMEWKEKADAVIAESEKLFDYITEIKRNIIGLVDGVEAIKKEGGKYKSSEELEISDAGRADLNITGQVGFLKHTVDGKPYEAAGEKLKNGIRAYSNFLEGMVADSAVKSSIESSFVTEDRYSKEINQTVKWERGVFDGMPAVATLTLLTKIQSDIRNVESQILQYLIGQIDAGDFRVNKIEALVIPNSKYIIRGGKYQAQIVLAATDSTKPLEIEVGGRKIVNGMYELIGGSVGKSEYKGSIKMEKPDGTMVEYPFKSDYIVGEPSATISADLMNVFYAGFSNPLSVSVPGVSAGDVNITATNCTLTKTAKGWNIVPSRVGTDCVITVTALFDGKQTVMGSKPFRVKKLPPPLAKIEYLNSQGIKEKFAGKGAKISKNELVSASRIVAELEDDDLDVRYNVLGFQVNSFDSMGNTLIEMANGSELTAKQMSVFKGLTRGKIVYISQVKARGPDGIDRILPPIEISIK